MGRPRRLEEEALPDTALQRAQIRLGAQLCEQKFGQKLRSACEPFESLPAVLANVGVGIVAVRQGSLPTTRVV